MTVQISPASARRGRVRVGVRVGVRVRNDCANKPCLCKEGEGEEQVHIGR